MARFPYLFGKYLRLNGRSQCRGFKKNNILHPIPVKAYGRPPSASSQTGLYHDEDYNYYTKVSYSLNKTRIKLKPFVFKKDFESKMLNTTVPNVRTTTSASYRDSTAIHAITSAGGFDNYILNTSPEHLRSHMGEQMRNVMYFYKQNPSFFSIGAPWKVFYSEFQRKDPMYSLYKHMVGKQTSEERRKMEMKRYSPFYMPPVQNLFPERQQFVNDDPNVKLNIWWKNDPQSFRNRLGAGRMFERSGVDINYADAYRKGEGRGGGGPSGKSVRRRSKTYRYNVTRPY
ncbi:conserved hypothetical protein [Theileria orientalis strain Shintoku]|uniref:Uncharacterized protein n=1 Tax=Theileria orientalis strain Shintoku TaxID=869250 RepID=J7M8I0_THEOR|nr:conserved hypothetical protein [Theileria orientalis strain Shintoku]BAM42318.1 conserved hypothetical protein [Theileria orientalis strain Shintoku]|eukprot:XP_009692619.1 conserved hypothetical protein [Theileria orientalis strain Shintoku]